MPTFACEDCGKEIVTLEDGISYFSNERCAKCEAVYLKNIEQSDALIARTPVQSSILAF